MSKISVQLMKKKIIHFTNNQSGLKSLNKTIKCIEKCYWIF